MLDYNQALCAALPRAPPSETLATFDIKKTARALATPAKRKTMPGKEQDAETASAADKMRPNAMAPRVVATNTKRWISRRRCRYPSLTTSAQRRRRVRSTGLYDDGSAIPRGTAFPPPTPLAATPASA